MVYYLVYCLGGKSQNGDNLILFHGIPLSNGRLGLINTGLTSTFQIFQRDHKGIHSEYLHKHHKHVSNCIEGMGEDWGPKKHRPSYPSNFSCSGRGSRKQVWTTNKYTNDLSHTADHQLRFHAPSGSKKGAGKSTIELGVLPSHLWFSKDFESPNRNEWLQGVFLRNLPNSTPVSEHLPTFSEDQKTSRWHNIF